MKPSQDDVVAHATATHVRTTGQPGADSPSRPAPFSAPTGRDPGLEFSTITHTSPPDSPLPATGVVRKWSVWNCHRPGMIPSPLNEYF